MATRRELYEQMGRRNAAAEQRARGDDRRWMLRAGASCVAWCAAGLFLLGWSMHTPDEQLGRIAFWGGLLVGNGGIFAALLGALARRGGDAGD